MRSTLLYWVLGSIAIAAGDAYPQVDHTLSPVSMELFQRFVRYTKFQAASKPSNCPSPPFQSVTIADIENTGTNTQARIFRDDNAMEIILGFPGSHGDDATNHNSTRVAYISPGINRVDVMVHGGYLKAWNSVSGQIRNRIQNALNARPGYKVVVVGHSLGGALTTLAYASLSQLDFPVKAGYSSGSPRLGDPKFADFIDSISGATNANAGNFYRMTHAADKVPDDFKISGGWRHPRTEYWQMGVQTQSAATTYRCIGQEDESCNLGATPKNMEDHGLYSNVSFGDSNPSDLCHT